MSSESEAVEKVFLVALPFWVNSLILYLIYAGLKICPKETDNIIF